MLAVMAEKQMSWWAKEKGDMSEAELVSDAMERYGGDW